MYYLESSPSGHENKLRSNVHGTYLPNCSKQEAKKKKEESKRGQKQELSCLFMMIENY